jgi:hypothetical protein
MKAKPKASEEFDRFTALVDQVIAVPRSEVLKREEEYQRQSAANPKRRGPKRKDAQIPSKN